MTKIQTKWVIVQHSSYGYADKEEFEQGLEIRSIDTVGELNKVLKAGGKVFDDYADADDYCFNQMFKDTNGMIPKAPGIFSDKDIDGLKIYIPVENIGRR